MLTNRSRAAVPLVLALIVAAGCSKPVGTVSGQVTYKGQPLTSGTNTVTFFGTDGAVTSCMLEPDGRYTIRNVSVGPSRISVLSLPPPPQMPVALDADSKVKTNDGPAGVGTRPRGHVGIPERYNTPERSGLTHEVVPGEQTFDITLTP